MGDVDKLWKNYVAGDMKYFFKETQKFTRAELRSIADNLEGLSIVLRRIVKNWDDVMDYPSDREE